MQDNPPPGDNPAPRPSDDQARDDQRPPAAERPADPGPAQAPASTPPNDLSFDLNAVGLDTAQRLYTSDGGGRPGDGGQASPIDKQFEQARAQFRRQPGREPVLHWDYWARFERGIDVLIHRVPMHDPAYIIVSTLEVRLRTNIALVRQHGDNENRRSDRNEILEQLNYQSIQLIQTSFTDLCAVGDTGANGADSAHDAQDAHGARALPTTQREVADWYTGLDWLERCYVIAVCVLRGAPSHEVSRAAHELHTLIEQAYPARQTSAQDEHSTGAPVGPAFISVEDLLTHTHTVACKIDGAERIMWRDEAFDPLVREFLARQATTAGMRFAQHNLLDILQGWAVSDDEERAFRAARVLADLWWRQHQDKLLELAETWAASGEAQIWQGGAALMYGAYVAERAERPDMKATDSEALRLLHEWSDWRDDDEGLALVAAYAYGLIGRQWPDAALDGLDYLLCLGATARKHNTIPPPSILFLAMLSYVEMASSGQIRPLLKRFASHAEYYTLRARNTNHGLLEPTQSYSARERSLEMLFFHFVFLAALSLSGVRKGGSAHMPYLVDVGLLPYPDMPSPRGQDVLLAGILSSQEAEWRANLRTLLCAAISTGRESLAFDLIASWIHVVTFEPRGDASAALLRFVLDLHRQLGDWDSALRKSGLRASSGALEQRLRVWSRATRENVLRPFAQRVEHALNAPHP